MFLQKLFPMLSEPRQRRKNVGRAVVLLLALSQIAACTSLRSAGYYDQQLRQKIQSGSILQKGERAIIHTVDGEKHSLTVEEVTATEVHGGDSTILIEDIVAVDQKQFSGNKTGMLLGSILVIPLALFSLYVASVTGVF